MNILPIRYDPKLHQQTLDYLSNLTPHSVLYNETVLRLRRSKRSNIEYLNHSSHKSINTIRSINEDVTLVSDRYDDKKTMHNDDDDAQHMHLNNSVHNNYATTHVDKENINGSNSNNTKKEHHIEIVHHNKINTEKHWRIMKNKIRQKIKFIDSHNQPTTPLFKSQGSVLPDIQPDCHKLSNYAWLFILTYVVFALSLFTFLILSESTVFTVTIITAGLPLIGIFWSLFELRTSGNTGEIIYEY